MKPETREAHEPKEEEPLKVSEVPLSIGDITQIEGVPCKLIFINAGKRRLTFTPVGKRVTDAPDDGATCDVRVKEAIARLGQVGQ